MLVEVKLLESKLGYSNTSVSVLKRTAGLTLSLTSERQICHTEEMTLSLSFSHFTGSFTISLHRGCGGNLLIPGVMIHWKCNSISNNDAYITV